MKNGAGCLNSMGDVNHLLVRLGQGDAAASDELLPLLYDELRSLARIRLAAEHGPQTLQPTALVHEAWLRLVGDNRINQQWDGKGHFFAAAATAMRRVLIDRARQKKSARKGGKRKQVLLESGELNLSKESLDVLDIEEALSEFEKRYPDQAIVVQMKFFAGLSHLEIANVLKVSESTIKRHWRFAKAWLHRRLDDQP